LVQYIMDSFSLSLIRLGRSEGARHLTPTCGSRRERQREIQNNEKKSQHGAPPSHVPVLDSPHFN
jgi:hypothetical protein